jgi:hypothetical protein
MTRRGFRAGDLVDVLPADEILKTLDADGTLHGLPFMPEMLAWCGKTFRVERRVEKTCVDVPANVYANRRFAENDVVFLEGPRCDGSGHDGCKRCCKIFWKEDWLRPAGAASTVADAASASPAGRLKTKSDASHYFCQSTQLLRATDEFPGRKKPWMLRILWRELRNGDRTVAEVARLLVPWAWQKWLRKTRGTRFLGGPNERTPTAVLDLEPGDAVRIRSRAEMVATLDNKQSIRGLSISYEMTRCCGREAEVTTRVDRMIDERTGVMRELRNTVALRIKRNGVLADPGCLCVNELGDCPRSEMMYWREIWLERSERPRSG